MRWSRVLITGCGGMLGNRVYPIFAERCERVVATDRVVSEPWLERLDVRDRPALAATFCRLQPDLVLHLAAETDLEWCEAHPAAAEATNARATRQVSRLCEACGATLVYVSTAGVFDGRKEGFYTEDDAPNPIMVYGRTKYEGERHAQGECRRTYVVRAGWMIGGGYRKDHKFVRLILEQVKAGRKAIHAVDDKWGTPTCTGRFAANLYQLLETEAYGTYHMVCEGGGTRYDVAVELMRALGRDDVAVRPVDSAFFQSTYHAPRPRSEMLTNRNLQRLGLNHMGRWRDALREYVSSEYADLQARPRRAPSGTYLPEGAAALNPEP